MLHLTRLGLPNIYTDGNYQSETLGQSGGAFPRHSNTAFLGQFGDNRIPNLVYIHNHFARGQQWWDSGNPTAGQIPRSSVLFPPTSLPHFLMSQQFFFFIVSPHYISMIYPKTIPVKTKKLSATE